MGRVHVAHLEAGALARQAARAKRRETALVRDLRQRVGLVHELRELRGTEELANGGCGRLRVDQVLRHDGVDIDRRHALLDRALHAQEADAVLVLHEFADRPDAAIAEVVDVVDLALAVAQVEQRAHDRDDVLLAQHAHGVRRIEVEAHVHLHAADRRQVVALDVEQQALEQGLGLLQRRRLARAHDAIDVEQRLFTVRVLVGRQRIADVRADIGVVDGERRQHVDVVLVEQVEHGLGDLLAGLDIDLAGLLVDHVDGGVAADQLLCGHADLLETRLLEAIEQTRRHLGAGLGHGLAGLGIDQAVGELDALHRLAVEAGVPAFLVALVDDLAIERREDLLRRQSLGLARVELLALGDGRRALLGLAAGRLHHGQRAARERRHVHGLTGNSKNCCTIQSKRCVCPGKIADLFHNPLREP